MKYSILYNEEAIASFNNENDALHFLEWKKEKILQDKNEGILDQIAKENGLDRKYPGLFPSSIAFPYYDKAREEIAKALILKAEN